MSPSTSYLQKSLLSIHVLTKKYAKNYRNRTLNIIPKFTISRNILQTSLANPKIISKQLRALRKQIHTHERFSFLIAHTLMPL